MKSENMEKKLDKQTLRYIESLFDFMLKFAKKLEALQILLGVGPFYFRKQIVHHYGYPYCERVHLGRDFKDGDIIFVEHNAENQSYKLKVWSKKKNF